MECSFISEKEIEIITNRNDGYKEMKTVGVTQFDSEKSDEELYTFAKRALSAKDTFTLTNDFDKQETSKDNYVMQADFVIFKENDKLTRIDGNIKRTGKSYIITKNEKSILVGIGNSVLFTVVMS